MKQSLKKMFGIGLLLSTMAFHALAQQATSQAASTARIVTAANAFLATLDAAQRQRAVFAYDDEAQRVRWSNFPIAMVPRSGVNFREMSPAQRTAAQALLAAVLSPRGVEKLEQIRQGDETLKTTGGGNGPRGGRGPGNGPPPGAGGPPQNGGPPGGPRQGGGPQGGGPQGGNSQDMFGGDLYFFSFLGQPSTTAPWMLQFGGHHLAVNITINGSAGVLTPTLTGAQPASYQAGGRTIRPLGGESDKAVALLKSLSDAQQKQAVLGYRVADLVLGPGQDGKTIVPEGLKGSAMSEAQRAQLLDLIGEWAGIVDEAHAAARMAQLKAELGETWFAWSGSTDVETGRNIVSYYRIQGPHLVIEYAPQGGEADHVHTMYRDPTNDYGRAPARK